MQVASAFPLPAFCDAKFHPVHPLFYLAFQHTDTTQELMETDL